MPITWNAESEAKLLLGILDQVRGTSFDYHALAAFMGPDVSAAAVKQRICKIRRERLPTSSSGNAGDAQAPAYGSPKKRKQAGGPETPTKKGKAYACVLSDGDANEEQKDGKPVIKADGMKK
ncbi:hypothetical protein BJY04DRAFT_214984 [Aspergillus karnatakaensis]|uniref:uncharacterized protein n=1 Tax=Aspergillus karnatakaensis TaxID=1810916 RepID=UPI003CCC9454